jgi:hypothetical protein
MLVPPWAAARSPAGLTNRTQSVRYSRSLMARARGLAGRRRPRVKRADEAWRAFIQSGDQGTVH